MDQHMHLSLLLLLHCEEGHHDQESLSTPLKGELITKWALLSE